MYKQSLVNTVEPIKKTTITRMNRGKKWKYGYNKEHDLIVLSHNGVIGEIIEIQNLIIALPKPPKEVYGGHKICDIIEEDDKYSIYIKKGNDVLPWKDFNKNMGISIEYNLEY